jgi:hypothetical protein
MLTAPEAAEARPSGAGSLLVRVVPFVVLAALGVIYLWGVRRPEWLAGDEAYYVGLARSLAAGEGFTFNGGPHAIYPPGFPVVLSPAVSWLGLQPRALTLFSLAVSLASLGAIATYLGSRGDRRATLPILIFFLASVAVFEVFTDLRSEGLFVLIVMLVLASFEWLGRGRARGAWALGIAAVLGLVAGLSLPAVRSIGVALPAAAVAAMAMMMRRRSSAPRRWMTAAGASVLGALAYQTWWSARGALYGEERSYGNLLTMVDPHHPDLGRAGVVDVGYRLLEQFAVQIGHGVELLTGVAPIHPFLLGVPHVAFVAVLALGLIRELRRPNPLAAWFVMAYFGIVVLWPFDEGTRFLLPIFPLLLVLVFHGSKALIALRPVAARGWRRVGLGALALGTLAAIEVRLRSPGSLQGWIWVGVWLLLSAAALYAASRSPRPHVRFHPSVTSVVWAMVLLHLAIGWPGLMDRATRQRAGEQQFNSLQIAGAIPWILERTDSAAVVAATVGAQGLHLHTSRSVLPLPTTGDASRLWQALDESGARFLVVPAAHEYPYLLPTGPERLEILDGARPGRLELVHTYAMGRIFELRRP